MGFYCITNINADFAPLFVDDLKKAVSAQVGKAGQHYCPAVFFEKKLSDAYVESLPCLWIDIDVPENYGSFEDAVNEWTAKLTESRIPHPTKIVSSGVGAHLYWYFQEGQKDVKDWLILRDAMIKMFMDKELKADFAHTHPSAYMRTMGSVNEKTGTAVKVVKSNDKVSFTDLLVKSADYVQGGKKSGALTSRKIFQGKTPHWDLICDRCEALRDASKEENQTSVSEALWRAVLSIAYVCEDGDKIIHEVSRAHPDYDVMKTEAKARATIPYSCQKIRECGGKCSACPHSVKSPVALGTNVEQAAMSAGKQVIDANGNISVQVGRYTVGEGGIYTVDNSGQSLCIASTPIYVGDVVENTYGKAVAGCYLEWENSQKQHRREFLSFADLCSGPDFVAWLGNRNLANKIFNQKGMIAYVLEGSSIKEKMSLKTGASRYGWQDNDLIMPYGKVTKNGIEDAYIIGDLPQNVNKPSGELKGCLEMVFRHLLAKNHGFLVAPMLMNIVAPMFPLLGVNPIVTYLSGQSGSGKSMVGFAAMCMYGFVDKYNMVEGSTTMNSLMDKMSSLNCLTLTLDEVSLAKRNDMREIIMQAVNGRPKGRLNKSAKQNTREEWWTPLIITSNSTYSGCGGDELDTAQGVRLAELSMLDSIKIPNKDIMRMREELVEDGANIAMYIVNHKEELKESMQKIMDIITEDDRYDPSMRFLAATWATIKSGLKIIYELYPSIFKEVLAVMPTLEKKILWDKVPKGSLSVIDTAVNNWINENNDKIAIWNSRLGCINEDKLHSVCARYSQEESVMYIKSSVLNNIIKGCGESIAAYKEWCARMCVDEGEIKRMRLTGRANSIAVVGYKMEAAYRGEL